MSSGVPFTRQTSEQLDESEVESDIYFPTGHFVRVFCLKIHTKHQTIKVKERERERIDVGKTSN